MRWLKTKRELIALCPIDGKLRGAHTPHAVSVESLRQAARSLALELRAAHDPGWAKYFELATRQTDDEHFLSLMGHSLAVLVRRGPLDDLDLARDELEQLLIDTVARWHSKPSNPQ